MNFTQDALQQLKKGLRKAEDLVADGITAVRRTLGIPDTTAEQQADAARITADVLLLYGAVRLIRKHPIVSDGFISKYIVAGLNKILAGVEFCLGVTLGAEFVTSLAVLIEQLLNKDASEEEAAVAIEEAVAEEIAEAATEEATEDTAEEETVEVSAEEVLETAEEAEEIEEAEVEPAEEADAVEAFAEVPVAEETEEAADGEEEESDDANGFGDFGALNFIDVMAEPETYAAMLEREKNGEVNLVTRYRKGYESRLAQSQGDVQSYYSEIKNAFLKYKGVKSRISWGNETFNRGRNKLAKVNAKNKTLYLYLAIDPATLADTKYNVTDLSGKKKYESVPSLLKIKGERKFRYAIELIDKLCGEDLALPGVKNFEAVDYTVPYQETEELVATGLIKKLVAEVPVSAAAPAEAE